MTDVNETYGKLQSTDGPHRDADPEELQRYSGAWQDESIPQQQGRIVDIQLAKPEATYTGSDYSTAMIAEARRRYPDRTFLVENASQMSLADRGFDCVMLSGAIEHIPDYAKAISEICRVARRYVVLHRVPMILAKKARLTLSTQYQVETPRIFLPHGEIVARMEENGFVLRDERPVYKSGLRHEIVRRVRRQRPDIRTLLFAREA